MKIKTIFLAGVTGAALLGSTAFAGVDTNALSQQLLDKGFTGIEIKVGATQVKVEGVLNGVKYEMVYDDATGALIKQETSTARASDSTSSVVQVVDTGRDFTDDNGDINDDDESYDDDDDHDGGYDDDSDDDNGDDDHKQDRSGRGHDDDSDDDSDDDDHEDDDSNDDDHEDDDHEDDDSDDD